MASKIGISDRQLERLIGRDLNASPRKYYTGLRLRVQTDISVTEIALATGFNAPTHFSKVYRAQFGTSPSGQKSAPTATRGGTQGQTRLFLDMRQGHRITAWPGRGATPNSRAG